MKNISIILILSLIFSSLGCQQSYITKKENESLPYLKEDKNILSRAARDAERDKFNNLSNKYTYTNDALFFSALKVTPNPWQNFEQIDIPIINIYTIQTPVIDSFFTGTLVAASSALIIYHSIYKDNYFPLPNF